MLSVPLSIAIVCLALWLGYRSFTRLWHGKASRGWWAAMFTIIAAGGYAGFRLGFLDMRVSPTLRWVGVPFPIALFQLEGDHWTDFVPPHPIQWLMLLADILIPIPIMLCFALIIWNRRGKSKEVEPGANANGSGP